MDADLRRAVADGELTLHYQPSFALGSGEMTRIEALVRWQHPDRGLLMPGHFVPFAETTGAIKAVTKAVLALALDQVVEWRAEGRHLPVAVNVSAYDLGDPDFADLVARMLAARDLRRLPRGMSSRRRPSSPTRTRRRPRCGAWPSRACGRDRRLAPGTPACCTSAGSRCTSSSWTAAWCRACSSTPPERSTLVRWTIEMAHTLGVTCVAEGVEDGATLDALRALACDEAQGFHLQVPVAAEGLVLDRSFEPVDGPAALA